MKTIILTILISAVQLSAQFTLFTPENSDLPSTNIEVIKVDDENRIWLGTDSGLVEIHNGIWKVHNSDNSNLPKNDIKDLSLENNKKLWVLLDSIIYKYENNEFKLVTAEKGGNVFAVDSNGDIWLAYDKFGQQKDLYKFENNEWKLKVKETKVNGSAIYNIAIDKNNNIWIDRASYSGVHCYKKDSLIYYDFENTGIGFSSPNSVCVDSTNSVWFTDHESFIKFDQTSGEWTRFGKEFSEEIKNLFRFKAIQFDTYNTPYLTSRHSKINSKPLNLYIMKDEKLETFNLDSFYLDAEFDKKDPTPMAIDLDNNVWIHISDVGLLKFDPSQTSVKVIPADNYTLYPNPAVSHISVDLEGDLLISHYKIIDTEGRVVLASIGDFLSSQKIDIHSLPVGAYVIELTTATGEVVHDKFVKR